MYRNQEFRNFYLGWEVSEYNNTIAVGFAKMSWIKFKTYWRFYFGPILSIPLIAVSRVLVDRRIRFLLIVLASMTVAAELETWIHPHYIAPMTCVLLAVVLQCMRHLQFWRWHSWQIGQAIVWAVVVGCFALDAAWVSAVAMHVNDSRLYMEGNQERATIERRLEQTPGSHLVIVHYARSHPVYREWVYNRGDIVHAKVVWARDLGPECNEKLVGAYGGRSVWLLEPDTNPAELKPYSAPALTGAEYDRCFDDASQ